MPTDTEARNGGPDVHQARQASSSASDTMIPAGPRM